MKLKNQLNICIIYSKFTKLKQNYKYILES